MTGPATATHLAEPVGTAVADVGEGPRWDPLGGMLLWVDIPAGRVHRTDPASGETETVDLVPPVAAVFPMRGGGWLIAGQNSLVARDVDGSQRTLAGVADRPGMRFNDGACDPAGRLWIGSTHVDSRSGGAALYRLDSGGVLTPVVTGVTTSNGLGWSPDGTRLYYVDTPTRRIDVFDYSLSDGSVSGRRTFADLAGEGGRPDGLTVDAEGGVWVALVRGGALQRYSADGHLDAVVALPVSHPTSCAFGGPGLAELYVTTAKGWLSGAQREEQPLAGRLLRLGGLGVTGFAESLVQWPE